MSETLIDNQPVPLPRVDFGVTAGDYARHRQGYPPALFDRLAALGVGLPGDRIADLGTGTGSAARALAARGAVVTGVDPSPALLAEAARLAGADGLACSWRHATAEATGLPTGGFDAVTAASAWHWFDRPRAAAEARRLLRPGGALAIVQLDWMPVPGSAVAITLELVARHRTTPLPPEVALGVNGIYPSWPEDLAGAGFGDVELFGFDVSQTYTRDGWRGRMRASCWVSTMPVEAQAAFETDLAGALAALPEPMAVPHRIFAIVGRAPR